MNPWIWQVVVIGGALLLVPAALLLLSLRWGRAAFEADYPHDVRDAMAWILGPAFILSLLSAVLFTTWAWIQDDPSRGYLSAYGVALGVVGMFCLIDLLIVDWLMICWWRPSWVLLPGTADAAGWGDYGYHVRAQFSVKGLSALFGIPAVLAATALLLPH